MHPNPAFRAGDDAGWLEFADAIGLAQIFASTPEGPMVVQAPVSRFGDRLRFHVARGNRITPHLSGAAVLVSVVGPEGYISPNWYGRPGNQVPTWNYVAAEFDGVARPIDTTGLIEQLDALADRHERRVSPAQPWTRQKMDPEPFERMLGAILGFEIAVAAVRGTRKLSQNKSLDDRARVAAALAGSGNPSLAAAMDAGRSAVV